MQPKYNRSKKGRSLLEIPIDYTVIDIETTDLSPIYGEIIEVGALKVRNNKIVSSYFSLIKIKNSIPKYITSITGITDKMLEDKKELIEIASEFNSFIEDDILLAHNANFDINFIYDSYSKLGLDGISNDFVDTLRLSRLALKDVDNHKLDTICEYYKVNRQGHRSLSDCLVTHAIYLQLSNYLNNHMSPLQQKSSFSKKIDLSLITSTNIEVDYDNYFFNKCICFTGKMDYLSKYEAAQITVNLGAICTNSISKKTDILVLGNLQHQKEVYGEKSTKHKKAEELIELGSSIEILTETEFLELIEQNQ